ncbi:MAG: ClC family H(+)/Cl(-) exchange transporter [Treponema sp.]|jgi:H+/Cl- antiporter ClcA|nr:ClC family H(+)/Cl(-) exchange transporter [Treponema sp.]
MKKPQLHKQTRHARLAYAALHHWYHSYLLLVLESVLIGFVAGSVTVAFRYVLGQTEKLRVHLYTNVFRASPLWLVVWAVFLTLLGLFLGWAIKVMPMIRGSGVPQVKGVLLGHCQMRWIKELPLKILTSALGLGAGLSLGRGGPSLQIASYVGLGMFPLFHRSKEEEKILLVAASSVGIAATFSAPLAGVLFALEELWPSFSPLLIASAMAASLSAKATVALFLGLEPVFSFTSIISLPLQNMHWVVLLGIACAILGDVFKRALYLSMDAYTRFNIPLMLRPLIPLLLSIPLGLCLLDVLGGGHSLIEAIAHNAYSLRLLLLFFACKLVFTAICHGSGTSGGIFFPLLACGALVGAAMGEALELSGFISDSQKLNFIILGMAAFFTSVVKTPIIGIVLILEMSGNFSDMGNLVLACLSAFGMSKLIKSRPVYSILLERMLPLPKTH